MPYTVTVNNGGFLQADNVVFTDSWDNLDAIFVSATGGGGCNFFPPNQISCNIALLPVGVPTTYTITLTAPAYPTTFRNTATISAPTGPPDPVAGNNTTWKD